MAVFILCYCIGKGMPKQMLCLRMLWQMLKPLAFATYYMADVIAKVADEIATAASVLLWQMLMPSGRWNKH